MQQPCASRLSGIQALGLLLTCFALTGPANGDDHDPAVPLFQADESIEVTLSAPWRTIVRTSGSDDQWAASLRYIGADGQPVEFSVAVERRGKSRQRLCRFPPIRLRFEKEQVRGTLFEGNSNVKLVTHCANGSRWEQYYVKEMLAYRIYNLVTEHSFRVRPLSILYHDRERDSEDGPRFAFAIEDDSLVARRNGLTTIDVDEISPDRLDPAESSRFALFQYLIGNEDWSSLGGPPGEGCCHNVKLIGPAVGGPLFALPYDFDSSGLVNAHYAAPQEQLPITEVRQRLYRGFCAHNATLEDARQEFIALKGAIDQLVIGERRLRGNQPRDTLRYFDQFFRVLADDRQFARRVKDLCRK